MARSGRPSKNKLVYNNEVKQRFIEEQYSNLDTQIRYKKLFMRTYEFENELNKDIYNFSLDEIKDMIISLSSTSTATLNSTISILRKYITWAINEKYLENPINVLELIDTNEIKNMISNVAQEFKYLKSKQDLINIINSTENAQDSICFVLAYHGLKADEILDVTIDDIQGNYIKVGNRTIYLEDIFMEVVHEAINQTIYIKNNGVISATLKSPEVLLESSRHIIRGTVNKGRISSKITKQVINNRIKRVIESFAETGKKETYIKLLTLVNVFYSGMFIKLHDIEQERPLTPQDYMNMREAYGIDGRNWNDLADRYLMWKKNL